MFAPSSDCVACHNNLVTPAGEDVSIGASWRGIDDGELRARSVRPRQRPPRDRSTIRRVGAEIEDECAACHVPAAQKTAHAAGGHGRVFCAPGTATARADALDALAARRRVVHGLPPDRIRPARHAGELQRQLRRRLAARQRTAPRLRRRSPPDAGPQPHHALGHGLRAGAGAAHPQSELCATCHTLITEARRSGRSDHRIAARADELSGMAAQRVRRRAAQLPVVPHAAGRRARCASPRCSATSAPSLARHTFLGGNAFMLRLMNRFRDELGVEATSRGARGHGAGDGAAARRGDRHRRHRAGRPWPATRWRSTSSCAI